MQSLPFPLMHRHGQDLCLEARRIPICTLVRTNITNKKETYLFFQIWKPITKLTIKIT